MGEHTQLSDSHRCFIPTLVQVAALERFPKLMTLEPSKSDIEITPEQFEDISRTIDYRMDKWCGYDAIIYRKERIGYALWRGPTGRIWLTAAFAKSIKLERS